MLRGGFGEDMCGLSENRERVCCKDRGATEGHQDSLDENVAYVED